MTISKRARLWPMRQIKNPCYTVFLDGNGTIMDTFATDKYLGYTDKVEKYPYDLEKAKALFVEAGVDGSQEISIIVYDTKLPNTHRYCRIPSQKSDLRPMYLRWNAPPMTTRA